MTGMQAVVRNIFRASRLLDITPDEPQPRTFQP
jgi:hypothetical protein